MGTKNLEKVTLYGRGGGEARCTLVFFMRDVISDLEASSLMSHSQLAVPLRILIEN